MEEFKLLPDKSVFIGLSPEEVTLIFYVAGLNLAKSLTIDELNVLANGLFEMAQVMFVIASQRILINDAIVAQKLKEDAEKIKEDKKSAVNLEFKVKTLQDQIEYLQKQIDVFKK